MRQLLNTLYVLTEGSYLSLNGENIVVREGETEKRFPLHLFENIVCFSHSGASPALMGKCASAGIGLSFYTNRGHFLARSSRDVHGNVLLRKIQVIDSQDDRIRLSLAKFFLMGKLYNSRWTLERTKRDYYLRIDGNSLADASKQIHGEFLSIPQIQNLDSLRGIEGLAANQYFSVFDHLIINNKDIFHFRNRTRRPPRDRVNALLSFSYSILANECANALESVGLDPYVGFLHEDRPGRMSLALDLMEELRSCMADRFVLSLINRNMIGIGDFEEQEDSAVFLNDNGRRKFLSQWQLKKQKEINHPYLHEKIQWGLVPFVQASLLSRCIRGDLAGYPCFFWK